MMNDEWMNGMNEWIMMIMNEWLINGWWMNK